MQPALSAVSVRPCECCGLPATASWVEWQARRAVANFDDEDGTEEVQIKEELETEVEPLKTARDPGCPTVREVEEHRSRGHLPYRTWCKWCNLGRGRGFQHRKSPGSTIPIVGLDYFFITSGGVVKKDELGMPEGEAGKKALEDARRKGDIVKCIVVRCSSTKVVTAHVVPCKGPDEDGFVVSHVIEDIKWLGHTKVVIKADGEPAIQALVEQVLRAGRVECKDLEQLAKEHPAAYDSQSNGSTEVGIRLVRGLFRTVKLCLEARLEKLIPVAHPIVHWMLEHVCLLLNTAVRGTDGLTHHAADPSGKSYWGLVKVYSIAIQARARAASPPATWARLELKEYSSDITVDRTPSRSTPTTSSSRPGPLQGDRRARGGRASPWPVCISRRGADAYESKNRDPRVSAKRRRALTPRTRSSPLPCAS